MALGAIFFAGVLSPVNVAEADHTIYNEYYDYSGGTWMCYICPTPPPSGGGGPSCNYDGVCNEGESEGDCEDCMYITRGNGSNLASPYDARGNYYPASDCGDAGTWMACPNQSGTVDPVESCTPSCGDVCGGSDGCGGTCGSQCNSGCPNAGNTSICPVFTCPVPNTDSRQTAASENNYSCGAQYGWNGSNYYPTFTPGTLTEFREKNPNNGVVIDWYCRYAHPSQGVNEYNGINCLTLPGFEGYKASLSLVDSTQQIYTGTEEIFWSVAMGWSQAPQNDPVSGATSAGSCLNWAGGDASRKDHCRQIYGKYACLLVVNNTWNTYGWVDCGVQTSTASGSVSAGATTLGGTFSRSSIRASGSAFDPAVQVVSTSEIPRYTYGVSGSVVSGVPVPPYSLVVNGWIPVNNLVYRKQTCTVWGDWYTTSGAGSASYGNCAVPNPRVNFTNQCPSGTAGTTVDIVYYNRYAGGPLTILRTDAYTTGPKAKCFAPPSNFTATPGAAGSGSITLSWTPVSGTQTIVKEGSTTVCGPTSSTSCTVSGLTPASSHTYTAYTYDNSQSLSVGGQTVNTGKVITYSDYYDLGISNYGSVFYNYPTASPVIGAPATASASAPQIPAPTLTGFTATPPSSPSCGTNWINISWTHNTTATTYRVYRDGTKIYDGNGVQSYNGVTPIFTAGSPGSYAFSDTGRTPGASHTYTFDLVNAGGTTSASANPVTPAVVQQVCAPAAPSNLTAVADSQTQITINWVDNSSNESYFRIDRSLDNVNWSELTTSPANTTSFAFAASPGTTYYYRIRATNAGGTSGYSNTASATTPPNAPTGLTATPSSTCASKSISVSWNAASGATSYTLSRNSSVVYTGSSLQYTDIVPANNTSYSYTVTAHGPNGTSAVSNTVSATSAQICPVTSTGFTATAPSSPSCGSNWINIAFYDSNADTYVVKRDGSTVGTYQRASISWTPEGSTRYYAFSDTGRTPAASHNYTLTLTNAGGSTTANAAPSYPVTVQQICAAAAPSGLSATANSQTQINLSWADNSSSESGFKVERSPNGSTGWSLVTTTAANATSYADTGLTANTTYYYRVRSTNAGGDSSYSNTASAATLPNAPAAPASLTPTPGACGTGAISLAWAASSGATSYTLKRGTQTIYSGSATSFGDTGLTPNTNYSYTVTASNAGGTSATTGASATSPVNCTTLTFTADATSVKFGGSTMLRWTPANATSCTASGDWSGSKSTSGGSQSTGNLSDDATYNLSCTGASGTVQRSVTVNSIPPSRINVNSNVQSAGWTITGNNSGESKTGNGNGNTGDLGPDPIAGTTYTIVPANINGYDFPPSISNSIGGGSSLLFFGGEHESFQINYVRSFNYTLSNDGSETVEKGGFDQYGQVVITETLTGDSGPSKPVTLSLSGVPSGVTYTASSCTPGGQPNCSSTITFTVTSSAVAGTYPITVTGSPLNKTTGFNLTIVNSPDLFVSCSHTPGTAQVGETVRWTANVSQTPSRAPYTYSWAGSSIPANTTSQSFDIVYSTTGTKSADATVRDSLGNVAHCIPVGTINISVNPQFQEF